ncbi:MAG: hypothetical protein IPK12_01585 [Gemmatimonadetes bacterium]|nr:hypothetical protein [Gemmatimonadota bacterium]
MTITGTGFSTVLAENQVELVNCGSFCDKTTFPMQVTAATTTQLTVDLPWNYPLGTRPQRGRVRVIVNGDTTTSADTTYFAFQPEVLGFTNFDFGGAPGYAIRAGDSIKLDVYGLPPGAGPASLTLSVDGDGVTVDSVFTPGSVPGLNFGLENQASLYFRLPTKVYSAGYAPVSPVDDTAYVTVNFSARGRSSSRVLRAWRYPRYQIPSGIGGTFTVGQSHTFVVNGLNMPGPFSVIFSPLGGGGGDGAGRERLRLALQQLPGGAPGARAGELQRVAPVRRLRRQPDGVLRWGDHPVARATGATPRAAAPRRSSRRDT